MRLRPDADFRGTTEAERTTKISLERNLEVVKAGFWHLVHQIMIEMRIWHALTWKSFSWIENMFPFENITSSNSILAWRWVKDSVETQKPSEAPEENWIGNGATFGLTILKNVNPIIQWW